MVLRRAGINPIAQTLQQKINDHIEGLERDLREEKKELDDIIKYGRPEERRS